MPAAHTTPQEVEMRVRKKPVEVEAVQLLWSTWSEMCKFADVGRLSDGKPEGCYIGTDGSPLNNFAGGGLGGAPILREPTEHDTWSDTIGLLIPTLKGVKGELYPCKPDIFEASYEVVDS
jgi:hypothetical protein